MFKRLQNIFICMVVASGLSACTVLEKRAEKGSSRQGSTP